MTKSLTEIQQENRRLILEAIHGVSYERYLEDLAKEELLDKGDGPTGYGQWVTLRDGYLYKSYPDENDDFVENDLLISVNDFVSKLLTLSQVLLALAQNDEYLEFNPCLGIVKTWDQGGSETDEIILFVWNLRKKTLEDQTEETQRKVWELLTRE